MYMAGTQIYYFGIIGIVLFYVPMRRASVKSKVIMAAENSQQ